MCLKCDIKLMEKEEKNIIGPSMDAVEDFEEIQDKILELAEEINDDSFLEMESTNADVSIENHGSMNRMQSGPLYFVQAEFINVRSGAGTSFGITGRLNQGEIVSFHGINGLERSPTTWNNNWGWVRMASSNAWVAGWPGTGFANSSGGHLLPAHPFSFVGQINGQVNFRTGPGTEFPTGRIENFLSLVAGMRINVDHLVARHSLPWSFTIPNRDLAQIWLRFSSITTPAGQTLQGQGWVRADLVGGVPVGGIPVNSPLLGAIQNVPRTATVISPFLNRRNGPGTHTQIAGQYSQGSILNVSRSQRNITEDRLWFNTGSNAWVASENTIPVELVANRVFRVNVPQANIRNAPDVTGTTVIGVQPANARLRITHRRRVMGGMDWFRFDQVIGGVNMVGWIADVNGFVEGEVGSPGIPMAANTSFPHGWIDSRPVAMRNPDYLQGHTSGPNRPFYSLRSLASINQIVVHHTASPTNLQRIDIEVGWRQLGWWNGGYHEMIHAYGRVDICYDPEVITNGAYGQNAFSYHICLVGDFRVDGNQPTNIQLAVLSHRIFEVQRRLGIQTNRVVGHSERTPTICPGLNMDVVRGRLSLGPLNPDAPTAVDDEEITRILQNLPRNVADVFGFGDRVGILNFLPNVINKEQQTPIIPLGLLLEGRITFQQALRTNSVLDIEIKDGQIITPSGVVEHSWNIVNNLLSQASIELFNLNEFTNRLGTATGNGTATIFFETADFSSINRMPWLTLKIAAETTLPSGNKFKYEIKFQIRPTLNLLVFGLGSDWDLGFESLPVEVQGEYVGDAVLRQSTELARHHRQTGELSFLQHLAIIAEVGIQILLFLTAIVAIGLLGAKGLLAAAVILIFSRRGIDVEIDVDII